MEQKFQSPGMCIHAEAFKSILSLQIGKLSHTTLKSGIQLGSSDVNYMQHRAKRNGMCRNSI
jgi:hypothetical protein